MGPICLGKACGFYPLDGRNSGVDFGRRFQRAFPERGSMLTTLQSKHSVDAELYRTTADVQCLLNEEATRKRLELPAEYPEAMRGILGFFMVFDRRIEAFESNPGALFDPKTVNIANEKKLWEKLASKKSQLSMQQIKINMSATDRCRENHWCV